MTKNEKKVHEYMGKWSRKLFLDGWILHVKMDKDETEEKYAEIAVNGLYREATITFYPSLFEQADDVIEETVLHELVHIITDPVKDIWHKMINGTLITHEHSKEKCEYMTSWVTQILLAKK